MLGARRFAPDSVRPCLVTLALLLTVAAARAQGPVVEAVAGQPTLSLGAYDLAPLGSATAEFFVSGTASSYTLAGAPPEDGRWNAAPAETAPYVTRIVVARPTDPRRFSGTVVVEWMNVTAARMRRPTGTPLTARLFGAGTSTWRFRRRRPGWKAEPPPWA